VLVWQMPSLSVSIGLVWQMPSLSVSIGEKEAKNR